MNIKERIVRFFASDLIEEEVKKEIERAKMALPITANYDPKNEGYRPMSGNVKGRNLSHIDQGRMFEIAYFMYDSSLMTKGLAELDKAFLFAEPITISSDDDDVQEILDRFWEDPDNNLNIDFPDLMMWLGLLGEQCWPVKVNPHNGHVTLGYEDPTIIKEVWVNPLNKRQPMRVDLMDDGGRPGPKMPAIRIDKDFRSKSFGRLVGDCFFFSINHPPNSPRGRSDFLTLFDWIDGLERYGFNYLERAEFMLNFVWDVLLKGMTEDQIRDWLQNNPVPQPGSIRAHNESVEWDAVAPELKAQDVSKGFNMGKSFIMGAMRRPESWFGGGGKAYQTEAEMFGQVPIKDLDMRQSLCKFIARQLCQFQVDQAVIHGRLSEEKAKAGFTLNFPEISKKDLTKLINGVPQFTTAGTLAENQGWISKETAMRMFAYVVSQLGYEIDVEKEIEEAGKRKEEEGYEDYVE